VTKIKKRMEYTFNNMLKLSIQEPMRPCHSPRARWIPAPARLRFDRLPPAEGPPRRPLSTTSPSPTSFPGLSLSGPSRVGVLRPPPTWGAQAAAGCPLLARRASTGRGCCVAPAPDCRGAPATARSEARRPSLIEWCSECSTDIAFAFDHSTLQSFLSDAGSPSGGSSSNAGHLALSFGVPGLMGLFQAFWSVLA
jgi:hypothetical protein